jgi:hypothetical protein
MTGILPILLPNQAGNAVHGAMLPVYVFTALAFLSLVRSCIHTFAPDGGAGSIAGLDVSVPGGKGVILAFGLWGGSQLVYAVIQLAVAFRYKSLIPAMYALLILETLLRILVGRMKPAHFSRRPPGAVGNFVVLPLAAAMLAISLWR